MQGSSPVFRDGNTAPLVWWIGLKNAARRRSLLLFLPVVAAFTGIAMTTVDRARNHQLHGHHPAGPAQRTSHPQNRA